MVAKHFEWVKIIFYKLKIYCWGEQNETKVNELNLELTLKKLFTLYELKSFNEGMVHSNVENEYSIKSITEMSAN